MTVRTNSRVAGVAYFLYLVAGIGSMALANRPGATAMLNLITAFCALALGVTLYALTRHVDPDVALFGMACRLIEAVPGEGMIFFVVGNLAFCWLLLRGRLIPAALAWLGVIASALLLVILPLQRAGLLGGIMQWSSSVTWLMWLPMLVFELAFAVWLIVKGVAAPAARQAA